MDRVILKITVNTIITLQPNAKGAGLSCDSRIQLSTKKGYRARAAERHADNIHVFRDALERESSHHGGYEYLFYEHGDQLLTIVKGTNQIDCYLWDVTRVSEDDGMVLSSDEEYLVLDLLPVAIYTEGTHPMCPGCREESSPGDHSPECPVHDLTVEISERSDGIYYGLKLWKHSTRHGGVFGW